MSELDDTLTSLGAKLDTLELTDDEQQALLAIFDAATDSLNEEDADEVAGFNYSFISFRSYTPTLNTIVNHRFSLPQPLPLTDYTQIQHQAILPIPMP